MANTFSTLFPEKWIPAKMQPTFFKENVALAVANMDLTQHMPFDVIHNPYGDYMSVQTYTKGSDVTISDRTVTDDSITVNTIKVLAAYIDHYDQVQTDIKIATHYAEQGQRSLNNVIDQLHNSKVTSAASYVDAGDVGGSAGSYITLSATNCVDIVGAVREKLGLLDVDESLYFIGGPRFYKLLRQNLAGRSSNLGDKVMMNGYLGPLDDFDMYQSNNCYFTATLGVATNPTDADWIELGGVRLTWKTTISTTAANVLRHASTAATSVANMVAAINDAGTVGTTYNQLAALNRWKFIKAGVVATDATTSITIVAYGELSTNESLTAAADTWSVQYVHYIAGMKKAVEVIVQQYPTVDFVRDPDRIGQNMFVHGLYGAGIFNNKTQGLVDVRVLASGWTTN